MWSRFHDNIMPSVIVYHPKKMGNIKITRPICGMTISMVNASFECSKLKLFTSKKISRYSRGRIPKSEATKSDLFFIQFDGNMDEG